MTNEAEATAVGEWEGTHQPIVVAVDGSERNRAAVSWAAHEAAAHHCELALVQALPEQVVPTPHFAARSSGDPEVLEALGEVRRGVRDLLPEDAVTTAAVAGTPVDVLLDKAAHARLVVVGKRGMGGFARLAVGSTSVALAGRSPAPVAIVPDGWDQREHVGRHIVLGVDPFKSDHPPIRLAFRRARRLGVPLVAVYGWESHSGYSRDPAAMAGDAADAEAEAVARFDELVARWRDRYPGVVVRPMRARKHPAQAILEAADEAQLIVLGRHPAGFFGGFAFGSVARAVLHYAECPVVAVPADGKQAEAERA